MKKALMAMFVLTTILVGFLSPLAVTSSAKAQSSDDWACKGGDSPCGFPIEGGRDAFVTYDEGDKPHDSCVPEGSCPWVRGHDYWWADEATALERPTQVVSILNGKVTQACALDTFNNKVIKIENSGWSAYYLHVDSCMVKVGQEVKIGDPLGIMGDTGRSRLTHLHFALTPKTTGVGLDDISPLWTSPNQPSALNLSPDLEFSPAESTKQLYRQIFDQNSILKVLLDTKVLDEDELITVAVWVIRASVLFVMLFIFLILRAIINKEARGQKIIRQAGNRTYVVHLPRGYFNTWSWLVVVLSRIVMFFEDDPVIMVTFNEIWWIFLGLTVFFWFAKRGEISRIRARKEPQPIAEWLWNWGVGSVVSIMAAYVWGMMVVLLAYVYMVGSPAGVGGTSLFSTGPLPVKPLEWTITYSDVPEHFKQTVREYGPEVVQIAREEDVPPEVIFTLVLKEGGQLLTNPANGEGLCGFYDLVVSRQAYFTPGPVTRSEALRQFRLCAQEFKKRSTGYEIHFETTDLSQLGPVYMRYNGNIDCYGKPFPSYLDHPYVMNGWDESHWKMVARDGKGGCVPLQVIGALPAHVRIGELLRSNSDLSVGGSYVPPVLPYRVYPGSYAFGSYSKYDYQNKHTGVDLWAPAGTAVYSSCTGTVVWWGDWPWTGVGSWQNTIWVDCHDGNYFGYTHLDDLETHANVGDQISAGQQIAVTTPLARMRVGDDAHLHWMRTRVDPTTINSGNLYWIFEDPTVGLVLP